MSTATETEFATAAQPYEQELLVHCYQMLGSVHDAQDLVQETLLRAWRAFDRFDPERASLRTWLHRIATNACLTALDGRARRPLPSGVGPVHGEPDGTFVPGFEVPWLQPLPDRLIGSVPEDPAARAEQRSQLRLAVVAARQLLTARQRAVLILRDVLGFSAAETAAALDLSVAAANSSLQRARQALARNGRGETGPLVDDDADASATAVVEQYMTAFQRADVSGLVQLLADEVVMEMPPMWNWYSGTKHYGAFMNWVYDTNGPDWKAVPARANRQPAMIAYVRKDGRYVLHTFQVFTVAGGKVTRTTVYQDQEVFEIFELPGVLSR